MTKQQARLKVRIYARLSKDDGDADKESNSISNQLSMLNYHSKKNNFEIVGEYVDDGISGTTFDRPDLNRMIEEALSDTEPSAIIVKDLSRFGRNNALVMYYVEEIFPNNNVHFIALVDDIDTRHDNNEMMPFKSIMNEYYARDTSKKVRSVKRATALRGGFTGSFAPYGYRVEPENKQQLLIDTEASPVVKRIFESSKQGKSIHQIARMLCKEGILIPRAYRAMKKGTFENSTGFTFPTDWAAKNVKMILENEVYIGHMVSHKTQTKSFKNKQLVPVPKEDWIIVKNTHEAIIDEETFEIVQKFISIKKRLNKSGKSNIFAGLIKCPDCGRGLRLTNGSSKRARLRCGTYTRNTNLCTHHSIAYDDLSEIVLKDIQKHVGNMDELGEAFVEEMRTLSTSNGDKKVQQYQNELTSVENRMEELDGIIMKLFEQNVLGKISDERFFKMSASYETEQSEIKQRCEDLKANVKAEEKKKQSTDLFLEIIRRYENAEILTRSMLVELIDTIYVYHPEGEGKERTQRVEINYRFLSGSQCGIA
ncbi:recombinase [Listeria newyorkensis]|uniref:Recombinase n=1 Tax=Listeria newyorkensis TaxID=1497681 RepID=A0ABX4XME9_9LIST|nr:recombinase family protein [Listeria newyorkensis]PNP92520.1 recombinase [Listeria newyorkensis]